MGLFIKAELTKLKNRKSCYIIPLVIGFAGLLIVNFFVKGSIDSDLILNNLSFVNILGSIILMFVLFIVSEDFSYNTWKNYHTLKYDIRDILHWKTVVQLINALILFIFFTIIFAASIFLISSGDNGEGKLLGDAIIKIIVSAPGYVVSILVLDMIFFKIKNVIVTILIYYYGFIQLMFLIMITGGTCGNVAIRVLFLPVQLGYLFRNELSVNTVVCSFISELLYIAVFGMIYKAEVDNLVKKELCGQ